MLNLADLGLTPEPSAATVATKPVQSVEIGATDADGRPSAGPHGVRAMVPGSLLAKTVYAAFSRQPVTIVDSPPGSGKTSLLIDALAVLLARSPLKIVLACPTKRGAYDVAERLASAFGSGETAPRVVFGVNGMTRPQGTVTSLPPADRGARSVAVRTVASCAVNPPVCDLLVFDEAYQTTFAQMATAADSAETVLMVGDPGQIGPVVTVSTSVWERMRSAPHRRAPEVFAAREDASVLRMDATFRLGAQTVEMIRPLYDFDFESRRPARTLTLPSGEALPEITFNRVPVPGSTADVSTMLAIARRAISMVGSTVHTTEADGSTSEVVLRERDIAVVVSRNDQASCLGSIFRAEAREGITVGTADRMQGGQWHAVVAVDPLLGEQVIAGHQVNRGRLCVMASRHMTHLTWVGDGEEVSRLRTAAEDHARDARIGVRVRENLLTHRAADLPVDASRRIDDEF